mgnify:FL=1
MTRARFQIVKEFGFEAAHMFAHKPAGHENTRVHGHSFKAAVTLAGEPDPVTGCVVDFEQLTAAVNAVRAKLDHRMLNDLPGLGTPSLENLARWIAAELAPAFPSLIRVTVGRPSLGETCHYEPA